MTPAFPTALAAALSAASFLMLTTTYLLHSTLLLGGTWLGLRLARVKSHWLRERVWKIAAVMPFVTAPLELAGEISPPIARLGIDTPSTNQPAAEAEAQTHPVRDVRTRVRAANEADTSFARDRERNAESVAVRGDRRDVRGALSIGRQTDAPPPQPEEPLLIRNESRTPFVPSIESPPTSLSDLTLPKPAPLAPTFDRPTGSGRRGIGSFLIAISNVILAIVVAGAARVGWQSVAFRRRIADAQPIADRSIRSALEEILRRAGSRRRIRLLASAACSQPAAFGVWRPTILLPLGLIGRLERDELRALLAHEAAHLVRGDAVWLVIGRVLCSCFSFQPLNFLSRREWRGAAEFLCDEWAVANTADRFGLARCLVRVAEWSAEPTPGVVLTATGARANLSPRVERLVQGGALCDGWDTRWRRRLVGLAALGLALGFICAAPRIGLRAEANEQDPEPATAPAPSVLSPSAALTAEIRQLQAELRAAVVELSSIEKLLEQNADPRAISLRRRIEARLEALRARSFFVGTNRTNFLGARSGATGEPLRFTSALYDSMEEHWRPKTPASGTPTHQREVDALLRRNRP